MSLSNTHPSSQEAEQQGEPCTGASIGTTLRLTERYNGRMQRKVFWLTFAVLGLIADVALPLWWALAATIPIGAASWWIAYRSEWF